MNMEERLEAVVAQAEADGAKWHDIVHGGENTTVATENGDVPTIAKQLKDARNELVNGAADYLGSCLKAKNETILVRDNALVIKTEIERLNADTREFRDTAENYKTWRRRPLIPCLQPWRKAYPTFKRKAWLRWKMLKRPWRNK